MIIPANILCKHSRVNNPWRTILPTKTNMDARHCRTELKTMSSLLFQGKIRDVDLGGAESSASAESETDDVSKSVQNFNKIPR